MIVLSLFHHRISSVYAGTSSDKPLTFCRFFGLPRRVKRTSLPQICDQSAANDDTDNIRLDPLPELDSSADDEGMYLLQLSHINNSPDM